MKTVYIARHYFQAKVFSFRSIRYFYRKRSRCYVYLRNRKHVPCLYRVIQTRVEVWENEKCCGNTSRRRVFPQLFRVLPNFHECLYNSIQTRSTCFLFLLENNATRKRKTTDINFDYENVNSLCSRHHYVSSARWFCISIELYKHDF